MKILEKIYYFILRLIFNLLVHPLMWGFDKIQPFQIVHIDLARIGNFVLSAESFLRNQQLSKNNKHHLFFSFDVPANQQIFKMYCEKMLIVQIPKRFVKFLDPVVNILKPTKFFLNLKQLNNEYLEFNSTPPQISLSPDEIKKGENFLLSLGIKPTDKIVCFHSRDSLYLQKNLGHEKDFSYHDYRDCQISNYLPAVEYLAEQGIYCFRMGAGSQTQLDSKNPRVIDYSHKYRTDFLDIYLVYRSYFFLGCTAGLQCVAQVLNIPVATCNYIPWPHPPLYFQDLVIYKQLLNKKNNKLLSFAEAKDRGFLGMHFSFAHNYSENELEVLENSSEDILSLVKEMLEQLKSGRCEMSPEQLEFKNNFLKTHPYFQNHCELSGRVANFMIKKYPEVYTIKK